MSTRRAIGELLTGDEATFRADAPSFLADHGLDPDRVERASGDLSALETGLSDDDVTALSADERDLVRRVWALDTAPLGITVAGPVYQDNPVVYANQTFRELTGYSLADVRGENLRLLQGADTEPGPVDSLREALDIWESVTVELWNYRADGTRFRNRVTLRPVRNGTGMITNWIGLQARVGD